MRGRRPCPASEDRCDRRHPERQLFLPVILGTPRQGRKSEHVARFVVSQLEAMPDVETKLIDLRTTTFPSNDEGEALKDPVFSAEMTRMDGLVIVVPEYNHGYPGMLKHALDTNLKEYIHKPVGLCGVSAGPWGGTRVIENLLPVLRELGLVTIFWDLNFPKAGRSSIPRAEHCSIPRMSSGSRNSRTSSSGWRGFSATGGRTYPSEEVNLE